MIVRCGDLFLEIVSKINRVMLDMMHVVMIIMIRMMMTASVRGRRGQSKGNIFGRTIF